MTLRKILDTAIVDRTILRVEFGLVHFRETRGRRSRVRYLPARSFARWAAGARAVAGSAFAAGLAVGRAS